MAPGAMPDRIRNLLSLMGGASTLLPHVSEISVPIQKRIEFGRLGELDLVDPAGALGVFIDELGLADQRLVHTKDFAAYGRIEVACGLDRLDNADRAALLHLLADMREFNKCYVAELFLSVVCYSNGSDTVLDDDILVILAVSNLHGLDLCLCCPDSARPAVRELRYKSMTMLPWGCE